jgi:hypothetical protein
VLLELVLVVLFVSGGSVYHPVLLHNELGMGVPRAGV